METDLGSLARGKLHMDLYGGLPGGAGGPIPFFLPSDGDLGARLPSLSPRMTIPIRGPISPRWPAPR